MQTVLTIMLKKNPKTLHINIKEEDIDWLICKERLHSTRKTKQNKTKDHQQTKKHYLVCTKG